eukprot:gnl/TRDRNA2_/TRDRNA2_156846_c2_seq1.p1 gnl/TRDRNA2_/TRDRNA2_156846_c2~~gnl/TRDRNA2_/TRDRNA2_156846_c2_seq1.p1  ORF type:complete len:694 (-),score=70.44 gnl/TRDRNA2_/TRDRNA2_156846_c2_seq1:23-1996(-)
MCLQNMTCHVSEKETSWVVVVDPSTGESARLHIRRVGRSKALSATEAVRLLELLDLRGGESPPSVEVHPVENTSQQMREAAECILAGASLPEELIYESALHAQEAIGSSASLLSQLEPALRDSETVLREAETRCEACPLEERGMCENYILTLTRERHHRLQQAVRAAQRSYQEALIDYDRLRSHSIELLVPEILAQNAQYEAAYRALQELEPDAFASLASEVALLEGSINTSLFQRRASSLADMSADRLVRQKLLRGIEPPEASSSLPYLVQLYSDAMYVQPLLFELVEQVAMAVRKTHAESAVKFVRGPLKDFSRAGLKAKQEYDGDYSCLLDLARASLECQTVSALVSALEAVSSAVQHGTYSILGLKNGLVEDACKHGGYRHINISLGLGGDGAQHVGHICELQLHLTALLDIKSSSGHDVCRVAQRLRAFEVDNCTYMGNLTQEVIGRVASGTLSVVESFGMCMDPVVVAPMVQALQSPSCRLVHLDLRRCFLEGELSIFLPHSACQCLGRTLRYLDMACNDDLQGEIPAWLGELQYLETLQLGLCRLIGPIPPEIGQLVQLKVLGLQRNRLSGQIPAALGSLMHLKSLDLSHNKLNGEIPAELGQCVQLEDLHLEKNKLSGGIPTALEDLARLSHVCSRVKRGLRRSTTVPD